MDREEPTFVGGNLLRMSSPSAWSAAPVEPQTVKGYRPWDPRVMDAGR